MKYKNDGRFVFSSSCLYEGSCLICVCFRIVVCFFDLFVNVLCLDCPILFITPSVFFNV